MSRKKKLVMIVVFVALFVVGSVFYWVIPGFTLFHMLITGIPTLGVLFFSASLMFDTIK